MFGDDLKVLVSRGIEALRGDAKFLREILGAVEGSQNLLEEALLMPPEGDEPAGSTNGPSASDDEVHLPGGRDLPARSGSLKATVSNQPPKDIDRTAITISDYALRAETALVAAKATRKDRKINLLRVVAPAAGGIIRLAEICDILIDMGLCQATRENLQSYLIKQMKRSGEFERVGPARSGVYQWVLFQVEQSGITSSINGFAGADDEGADSPDSPEAVEVTSG